MIQRPALHVLGCAPAGGNPGEPCSGYLVTAGGSRILLDCGPGVVSSLLARDAAPLDAIVLSHLHFDHVADLIPLGFAHVFGLASEWKAPALYAPPGGEARLAALCEAGGHGADHLTACGLTVAEYDPAAGPRDRRCAPDVPRVDPPRRLARDPRRGRRRQPSSSRATRPSRRRSASTRPEPTCC